jgi:predicted Zn-dependent protease
MLILFYKFLVNITKKMKIINGHNDFMSFLRLFFVLIFPYISVLHAFDGFQEGSIILDDEVEDTLGQCAENLSQAAQLRGEPKLRISLLVDPSINAFATVGREIYVHSGLVLDCTSFEELWGVLAHETAHIAGGHVVRLMGSYETGAKMSTAGTLLGGLVALMTGNPALLAAGMMSSSHMAERNFLKDMRGIETEADDNASNYLKKLGISPKGLETFLSRLREPNAFSKQEKYSRSHPLSHDRLARLRQKINRDHGEKSTSSKAAIYKDAFERLKAKIAGILLDPKTVIQRFSNNTLPHYMARALAYARLGNISTALKNVDAALVLKKSAYLYEIKGQILFESAGRFQDRDKKLKEAKSYFEKAYTLSKKPWIAVTYAHLLSEIPSRLDYKNALNMLKKHGAVFKEYPFVWRLQAKLHGKLGHMEQSQWMGVEEALASGDKKRAQSFAKRLQIIVDQKLKASASSKERKTLQSLQQKLKDVL